MTKSYLMLLFMLAVTLLLGCEEEPADVTPTLEEELVAYDLLTLQSPAFAAGEEIPERYTCDGEDVPPVLTWQDVPTGVGSYALIMEDVDAPGGLWVHWVVYNIPPGVDELGEDAVGVPGLNSWNRTGYGGPCPPAGEHRYFFKLYALDTLLDLEPGADAITVREAMEGHILAEGELMGTYERE